LAFSFFAQNAECYSAGMNSPMVVYLFRDSLPSRSNTVVCVGEKERIEAAFGGQLAVLFKGEAVYSNDSTNRTYLGVWGARNTSRLRRLLREQGVELLVKRTRPPNTRLRSFERSEVSVGFPERARGSQRSFAKNAQDFGRRLPRAKDARSRLQSASS
jgi:hypothetical protein